MRRHGGVHALLGVAWWEIVTDAPQSRHSAGYGHRPAKPKNPCRKQSSASLLDLAGLFDAEEDVLHAPGLDSGTRLQIETVMDMGGIA